MIHQGYTSVDFNCSTRLYRSLLQDVLGGADRGRLAVKVTHRARKPLANRRRENAGMRSFVLRGVQPPFHLIFFFRLYERLVERLADLWCDILV